MRWMFAAFIAIAPALCQAAEAFKCVDARGRVTFASTPCPGGSGSASVVEARNTPPGGSGAAHMPTLMYDPYMVGRSVAPSNIARGSLGLSTKRAARMGDSATSERNQRIAGAGIARAEPSSKKRMAPDSAAGGPLIDAGTGRAMPAIGGGNYIDPATGTVMVGAAVGVINSRTGAFSPTADGGSARSAHRRERVAPPTCEGQARELQRANSRLRGGYSSGNDAREQRRAIESWQRSSGC